MTRAERIRLAALTFLLRDTGQIAIVSATADDTNQNTWVGYMKQELTTGLLVPVDAGVPAAFLR